MNVGYECEREATESDGHGRVPCRWPRCVAKSKVLIGYVGREHHSTDDKGGQPPEELHLAGRSPPGKCGGCDTNGEVEHAGEYHGDEPSLAARVVHTCGLTKLYGFPRVGASRWRGICLGRHPVKLDSSSSRSILINIMKTTTAAAAGFPEEAPIFIYTQPAFASVLLT